MVFEVSSRMDQGKHRKAVHGLSGHLSWEVFVFSRRTIMEWQGMESCILKRSKSGI